ncbi:F-box/LRR-repeat protein 4-like [Saccostrea cucullata]|uniref:F-box/LRR-repeat protein 4-like n=1 Tax=Saccostrea cuccullata TaxID=36930 RepID=UPI002ED6804E
MTLKIPSNWRDCCEIFSRNQPLMEPHAQFAVEVTDFSSQYGSETSISYTASNLAGRCNIYPGYGDFTQACVFRTYGPWWKYAPSGRRKFKRTPPNFVSQDYIELEFEYEVFPTKIDIYETYNPGTIVRILACDSSGTDVDKGMARWKVLWEGNPERAPANARVFSPPIREINFPTNVIRIEVCHDLCDYYTELDAVCLHGDDHHSNNMGVTSRQRSKDISQLEERLSSFTLKEQKSTAVENGTFSIEELPEEVIQLILSYLDIPSLCKASITSKFFHKHCYDSLQYKELDLQPHWTEVNNFAIDSLLTRCHFLQHLNISWCGGNQMCISPGTFSRFLEACGRDLQTLYMSSCKFVNGEVIKAVAENCPKLKELDVGSCPSLDGQSISHLSKIHTLERLNLYRLMVERYSLMEVLRVSPNLKHLNLGATRIGEMHIDNVMKILGKHCKNLISLDLWRSRISETGLDYIAENCKHIEELDLGWCSNLKAGTYCFIDLVKKCPNIKKLYLTANRTISNEDLLAFCKYCPQLEQLDILGTGNVGRESVFRETVKDYDRSGCPLNVSTEINVSEVEQYVIKDRRVTIREIANDLSMSYGTVQEILTSKLNMRRVCARWVPRLLLPEQMRHPSSPSPIKARVTKSAGKVMLIVFYDINGIILNHMVPPKTSFTGDYYARVIKSDLMRAVKRNPRSDKIWIQCTI